jgi:uncharacterized protein (TIGR00251 family)
LTVDDLVAEFKREGRISLTLRVTPKSPRTAWAGRLDDGSWKIRLAAVAEDGKANAELVRFLASEFGAGRGSVTIVSGAAARMKLVKIVA